MALDSVSQLLRPQAEILVGSKLAGNFVNLVFHFELQVSHQTVGVFRHLAVVRS